jgi:TOM7 family
MVPRRRRSGGFSISSIPHHLVMILDIHYVFEATKIALLWGFAPTVLLIGLRTEPRPSLIDIFNIWE